MELPFSLHSLPLWTVNPFYSLTILYNIINVLYSEYWCNYYLLLPSFPKVTFGKGTTCNLVGKRIIFSIRKTGLTGYPYGKHEPELPSYTRHNWIGPKCAKNIIKILEENTEEYLHGLHNKHYPQKKRWIKQTLLMRISVYQKTLLRE